MGDKNQNITTQHPETGLRCFHFNLCKTPGSQSITISHQLIVKAEKEYVIPIAMIQSEI